MAATNKMSLIFPTGKEDRAVNVSHIPGHLSLSSPLNQLPAIHPLATPVYDRGLQDLVYLQTAQKMNHAD